jgi:hypothetical protein
MKECPILFSAPMVRALLAGTKTQTRRVIKDDLDDEERLHVGMYCPTVIDRHGYEQPGEEVFGAWTTDGDWAMKCPYGKPGDLLWVREAWHAPVNFDGVPPPIQYEAIGDGSDETGIEWGKGRPSIFMLRWASRILLEVTDVRVQRLQDISEEDAIAEGIGLNHGAAGVKLTGGDQLPVAIAMYRDLWESINGADSWAANPWVWAVSFKRIKP